jgi:glutamine cyclotransferase
MLIRDKQVFGGFFCRAVLLALGLSVLSCPALASPLGGLTVALSPDSGTLVASGSNRAFLRMDPGTLEVTDRIWNGLSVTAMAFSRDGGTLAVTDAGSGGFVTLFDAKTLQRKTDVRRCEVVSFSTAADLFAGIEGNRTASTTLHVYGLSDGASKMKVSITPRRAVVATALDLEGKVVAVLYTAQDDPDEKKIPRDRSLQGLESAIAEQQGDGKTSDIEFYSIATGELLASHTLFFSLARNSSAIIHEGRMVVVSYQNQNAVIAQDGTVTMFLCANSFNYGIGFTSDHEMIMTGGLANMSLTTVSDLTSRVFPVREKLASWPEYFRGFAGNAEGSLYGATDGFRVIGINRNASVFLEKPAF